MKLREAIALTAREWMNELKSVRAYTHKLQQLIRYSAIIIGAVVWACLVLIAAFLGATTYSLSFSSPLVALAILCGFIWFGFWLSVFLVMLDSWLDSGDTDYVHAGA